MNLAVMITLLMGIMIIILIGFHHIAKILAIISLQLDSLKKLNPEGYKELEKDIEDI
jgi:hypothetical protein